MLQKLIFIQVNKFFNVKLFILDMSAVSRFLLHLLALIYFLWELVLSISKIQTFFCNLETSSLFAWLFNKVSRFCKKNGIEDFLSKKTEKFHNETRVEGFRKGWEQPNGSGIWSTWFFVTSQGG